MLDIRIPIGLMFAILGAILVVYGLGTFNDAMYARHSLGINVNFAWGGVLLAFAATMLGLAWRHRQAQKHRKG